MSIRFLLLDLGGVIIHMSGFEEVVKRCARVRTLEELRALWVRSRAVRAYETGYRSELEFGHEICEELGFDGGPSEFLALFETWAKVIYAGAPDLLATLSQHGPTLVSVSNVGTLHWRSLQGRGVLEHFHRHFPSFVTGQHKPDHRYFRHVLHELGAAPQEVLYFDDTEANVRSASKLGINAVRVQGIHELRRELHAEGFLPDHLLP